MLLQYSGVQQLNSSSRDIRSLLDAIQTETPQQGETQRGLACHLQLPDFMPNVMTAGLIVRLFSYLAVLPSSRPALTALSASLDSWSASLALMWCHRGVFSMFFSCKLLD